MATTPNEASIRGPLGSAPDRFGPEFLDWFRAATEAVWHKRPERRPLDSLGRRDGALAWPKGTKWTGPLSASQVDALEKKWGVKFPADYRLFLETLHHTTRTKDHAFYDWLQDAPIHEARNRAVEGLLFDVEHNSTWLEAWGPRPSSAPARELVVRQVCSEAPGLIPVFAHRHMLSNEAGVGSAVLSVWQTDIIVYGIDLRDYLLNEFADLLGLNKKLTYDPANYKHIPVWGPFIG